MTARGDTVGYDPYYIQTEFEVIQSEIVLNKVIEDLDLNTLWGRKYANGERLKTSESLSGCLRGGLIFARCVTPA